MTDVMDLMSANDYLPATGSLTPNQTSFSTYSSAVTAGINVVDPITCESTKQGRPAVILPSTTIENLNALFTPVLEKYIDVSTNAASENPATTAHFYIPVHSDSDTAGSHPYLVRIEASNPGALKIDFVDPLGTDRTADLQRVFSALPNNVVTNRSVARQIDSKDAGLAIAFDAASLMSGKPLTTPNFADLRTNLNAALKAKWDSLSQPQKDAATAKNVPERTDPQNNKPSNDIPSPVVEAPKPNTEELKKKKAKVDAEIEETSKKLEPALLKQYSAGKERFFKETDKTIKGVAEAGSGILDGAGKGILELLLGLLKTIEIAFTRSYNIASSAKKNHVGTKENKANVKEITDKLGELSKESKKLEKEIKQNGGAGRGDVGKPNDLSEMTPAQQKAAKDAAAPAQKRGIGKNTDNADSEKPSFSSQVEKTKGKGRNPASAA